MKRRLLALVVLLGLVAGAVALRLGYDDWRTDRTQAGLQQELSLGTAPRPVVREDAPVPVASRSAYQKPFAELRIPRFGDDWEWAVVEGTDAPALELGPGHYPGTPMPGEMGNAAIAAHRAGHGDPFIDFDDLRDGDAVEVTQGDTTWVYRVVREPWIVAADAHHVLDPLPGRKLTLTTCWPKYGSAKRLIAVAELDEVVVDGRSTAVDRAGRTGRAAAQGDAVSAGPVASP
jgi:sortase A